MNANTPFEIINYIVNIFQDGNLSPDEYNLIINQAQTSFMDYLLGEFQQYQYKFPESRIEFGQNETVRQRLSPFIDSPSLLNVNSQGLSPYPVDYVQIDAMYQNSIYMNRVRYAQQHQLFAYLSDPIDPIPTNPIYLIESTYFRFYPANIGTAKISYVKKPRDIVWAFTDSIYGEPVYDAGTSVDPLWYDVDMLEIISRALKMVGINLQANQVAGYAESVIKQGQ